MSALEALLSQCLRMAGEDPFVVVAAGRSWFRARDLVELAGLVREHRA